MSTDSIRLQPIGDRLVIKVVERENVRKSGIVLPDTAKDKPQQRGEVLAVGPGKRLDNGKRTPIGIEIGQKVLFDKFAVIEVTVDGEEYLVLEASDVMAILE